MLGSYQDQTKSSSQKRVAPKKGFTKSLSCASTTIVRKWIVEVSQDGNRCSIQSHSWSNAMYSSTLPVVTWADHRGKVQKLSSAGVLAQRNPVKWAIIKTRMIGKFGKLISSEKRSWENSGNVFSVRVSFSPWESFPEQVLCSRNKILYLLVTL